MMKKITVTKDACERLKTWKETPRESFSRVVLKAVPKRGTAGSLEEAFKNLTPISEKQALLMEETVAWGNDWK